MDPPRGSEDGDEWRMSCGCRVSRRFPCRLSEASTEAAKSDEAGWAGQSGRNDWSPRAKGRLLVRPAGRTFTDYP
jgi:hypothetical protein